MKENLCPICENGYLQEQVKNEPFEYKNKSTVIPMHFSICNACGSEQSDASQTRVNKRAVLAFKKRVDGLLPGDEVRKLRESFGLSQAEASLIFGGGPVAFSKYENDDVTQSEAMDNLLWLAKVNPCVIALLAAKADVKVKSISEAVSLHEKSKFNFAEAVGIPGSGLEMFLKNKSFTGGATSENFSIRLAKVCSSLMSFAASVPVGNAVCTPWFKLELKPPPRSRSNIRVVSSTSRPKDQLKYAS